MYMEAKQHGLWRSSSMDSPREALQGNITRVLKGMEDDAEFFKCLFSSYPTRLKAVKHTARVRTYN